MTLMGEVYYESQRHQERDAATVGIVEEVSANQIAVGIVREAPHGTGLRRGVLQSFPRINSCVVIPSEHGSLLALVVWIGVDVDRTSDIDKTSDFIGLPTPRRRLRAVPLGQLRYGPQDASRTSNPVSLDRGGLQYPTVGDPVRLPTPEETRAAVPQLPADQLSLPLGQAVLAGNQELRVDPNRLFGRHLAVLGNTGSGKSCSLAHLLRTTISSVPNIRGLNVIILDPNGEYDAVFDDLSEAVMIRKFTVKVTPTPSDQFRVPYWLWNYREWLSFTEASPRAQAPQLRRCLYLLRTTGIKDVPAEITQILIGRYILQQFQTGAVRPNDAQHGLSELDNVLNICDSLIPRAGASQDPLHSLKASLRRVLDPRRGTNYKWDYGVAGPNTKECAKLIALVDKVLYSFGVKKVIDDSLMVDDTPSPFDARRLISLLPLLAIESEATKWVTPLVERLRIAMANRRQASICDWQENETLMTWIQDYAPDGPNSQVTIIDLSLIPSHILHTIVAVFVRVMLESMERCHRLGTGLNAPRILVVDEAHRFMGRGSGLTSEEHVVTPTRLCRESFERVAREGRKFGLSLVIASQRPADLSETVLSQCNTFLLHRIVSERDQRFVERLMPDSLAGLTQELPALPGQTGLLVGWAAEIPVFVRIADLDKEHQPKSADPDYVGLWQGRWDPGVSWESVVSDWTSHPTSADNPPEAGT